MSEYQVITKTEEETMKIAGYLATLLAPNDVITLEGELGVGKTTFTKGIARGLEVSRMVTSPTFTIVKEYEGRLPLYHMDAYRLEHSEEDIGFSEYFNGNGISIVEWAQFIEDFLPNERLNIEMEYGEGQSRVIRFVPSGAHFKSVLEALEQEKSMKNIN